MKNKAYLSIGTNLGDREQNLKDALELLRNADVDVQRVSKIYETEPVGGVPQDDFLNIAVAVDTDLNPEELLQVIHSIETDLHRKRLIHWGPRTIDLDILYFNDDHINTDSLKIPHPEIPNRKFVLVPLLEVLSPDSKLYAINDRLLKETTDKMNVRVYKSGSE
ncbi:2-amino-4-hydroxy-6-hydroxymethyldihydropteridine diphosphokinase [Lentilactobacillus sp. SPB1-3]|uniref:2-amino-4-hydroxy-6-hydroxymethyldihydropteridine diphosphokinase n=1 Tax=Lentilactobacillus terminaliae TaxID=3003483 RepID=A0ACD5DCS5_9LACO|nr:2-amino-4-hydroxy-6-hydroxymethyldihydropteridine diphosphokinase [Lentilactobacillus sp. SPB1-3]MCZ0977978.1 2-amino-4-hydroxy-6-hydroxymethyldihydropteridine diphosphokinase [Lentilactobacillus sp. SPB1-3]